MRFSKALVGLAAIAAATVFLSGCCAWGGRVSTGVGGVPRERITGSFKMASQDYDLDGFTGVEAMSAFAVEIVPSDQYEVKVTANENVLDHVEVQVEGDVLKFSLPSGYTFTNIRLTAEVGMPELALVKLSGASRATLKGKWKTERFEARLSGASNMKGDVTADEMLLNVSGSSRIELDGAAARLEAESSGASALELGGLEAVAAQINLSGASRGTLDVTDRLDAHLSGASRLEYGGSPVVNSDVSGGSTLRKR